MGYTRDVGIVAPLGTREGWKTWKVRGGVWYIQAA
jgi:hypothetical protein